MGEYYWGDYFSSKERRDEVDPWLRIRLSIYLSIFQGLEEGEPVINFFTIRIHPSIIIFKDLWPEVFYDQVTFWV